MKILTSQIEASENFRLVSGGEISKNPDGTFEISEFQLQQGGSPVETFGSKTVCLDVNPEVVRIEVNDEGVLSVEHSDGCQG